MLQFVDIFAVATVKNTTITLKVPNVPSDILVTSVSNWIVIYQRVSAASTLFGQPWLNYTKGFGSSSGDFWLGLERMYEMTSRNSYQLRIEFLRPTSQWYSTQYTTFSVGSSTMSYTVTAYGYLKAYSCF